MFFIRYKDTIGGSYIQMSLTPGPTDVVYPEKRAFKVQTTPDGAAVISRPMKDSRSRKWSWKRYRQKIVPFKTQWAILETLEYRTRLLAGKPATVEIWENESVIGGFDRMSDPSTKIWTVVKFIRVERTVASGGGPVIFDDSFIEFQIEDLSWSTF